MTPARRPVQRALVLLTAAVTAAAVVAACSATTPPAARTPAPAAPTSGPAGTAGAAGTGSAAPPAQQRPVAGLPGMPPVLDSADVYAADRPGGLSAVARRARPLVYVPHTNSNDVWVIDPATYKVVERVPNAGAEPQHVVPSYDLRSLYVRRQRRTRCSPSTRAPAGPAGGSGSPTRTTSTSPRTAGTRSSWPRR